MEEEIDQYIKIHATPEQITQMINNYSKIEEALYQKNKENIELNKKYAEMRASCEQL